MLPLSCALSDAASFGGTTLISSRHVLSALHQCACSEFVPVRTSCQFQAWFTHTSCAQTSSESSRRDLSRCSLLWHERKTAVFQPGLVFFRLSRSDCLSRTQYVSRSHDASLPLFAALFAPTSHSFQSSSRFAPPCVRLPREPALVPCQRCRTSLLVASK